ncbi:MAG: hypothetical protein QOD99_2473 [Chthoniobacter sp.]|nr:hypothetical protein [Chthoniobacter sp.]
MELQITERTRELEAALLELKAGQRHAVQQERLHAFAEMAGGVCHDFNNALMSVIGYSDLLLQDPAMLDDRETTLDYLKTMNTAGRDAAQVIGRLRDFYRPREQIDVFESLNLNVVIEQAVALTQPKWKNQPLAGNQTVSIELDLQKVPSVSGNAAELREVLTNLLFNAVDAMPGGGVITLRTHRAGDDAVLEIIDTGCGMSEEVRVRCLEPFFSTKGERGTGLGLPMVFGIIKRHEGQLEIESEIGSGTTFRICLPGQVRTFAQAEITPDQITRPLNVLVVDDDPVCRDVVGKYLTADGHGVVFAANGTQAMENLKTESFDLLITDYAIPGFNGVEIAEALRILGGTQPVLLLTGFDDVALPGKTDVVDMMLVKPLSQNDLRRALKTLMDRDATYTTSHAKDPRVPISYSLEAL